jgi:chaperonin GroES
MGFAPLHNNVAVERLDKEEKSAGGIIIPDTAQERPTEGRVVAAGPGARGKGGKVHKMDVKVGDRVVFSAYAGTETTIDGDDLVIMPESDIMGVIE